MRKQVAHTRDELRTDFMLAMETRSLFKTKSLKHISMTTWMMN